MVTVISLDHIVFPWLCYSGYMLGDMTPLSQCDLLAIRSGLWRFALHWNSEMMPSSHSVLHHNPSWHKWKSMTANSAQNMTAPVTIEMPDQRHKCTPFSLDKQERTISTHTFHIFQITLGMEFNWHQICFHPTVMPINSHLQIYLQDQNRSGIYEWKSQKGTVKNLTTKPI